MDVEATVFPYEIHNQPGDNFVKEVFSLKSCFSNI